MVLNFPIYTSGTSHGGTGSCVSALNKSQLNEWNAAQDGFRFSRIGIIAAIVMAVTGLTLGYLGFLPVQIGIDVVGLIAAFSAFVAGKLTYFDVPDRRFGKQFQDEFRCRPLFGSWMRGETVRVRCPGWMIWGALGWIIQTGFTMALFFLCPSERMAAIGFAAGWIPVAIFWGVMMASYATIDVLIHEAAEQVAIRKT